MIHLSTSAQPIIAVNHFFFRQLTLLLRTWRFK